MFWNCPLANSASTKHSHKHTLSLHWNNLIFLSNVTGACKVPTQHVCLLSWRAVWADSIPAAARSLPPCSEWPFSSFPVASTHTERLWASTSAELTRHFCSSANHGSWAQLKQQCPRRGKSSSGSPFEGLQQPCNLLCYAKLHIEWVCSGLCDRWCHWCNHFCLNRGTSVVLLFILMVLSRYLHKLNKSYEKSGVYWAGIPLFFCSVWVGYPFWQVYKHVSDNCFTTKTFCCSHGLIEWLIII